MGGASRSEAVTVLGKRRVPPLLENLQHGLLDQSVDDARHAELSDPAVRLGDFDPLDRLWLVGSIEQLRPNAWPVLTQVVFGVVKYLFPSRFRARPHLSTRQYARIVHAWVESAGLDESAYGTHSMRRTKAAQIYKKTGNLRAVQLLLGHTAYCPRTRDGSQGPLPLPSAIR